MNVMFLREVQLEILGVVLSLLRWTMLLREGSTCQLCSLLWLCVTTIARVVPSRTKCLLGVIGRVHHAAVILHRRLVLDTVLSDLLHCLWKIELVATSPMRWRAQLPWMSHERMSPIWGHSVHVLFLALHSPPWQACQVSTKMLIWRIGTMKTNRRSRAFLIAWLWSYKTTWQ